MVIEENYYVYKVTITNPHLTCSMVVIENSFAKIRHKIRVSTLTIIIQFSIDSPSN